MWPRTYAMARNAGVVGVGVGRAMASLAAAATSSKAPPRVLNVLSPFDGRVVGAVPLADAADAEHALATAHALHAHGRPLPVRERLHILEQVRAHKRAVPEPCTARANQPQCPRRATASHSSRTA